MARRAEVKERSRRRELQRETEGEKDPDIDGRIEKIGADLRELRFEVPN